MLSVMSLPGIKALWVGEIIRGRIFFSRLAKTLEINLYKTLHKLIDLNSVTHDRFFYFRNQGNTRHI